MDRYRIKTKEELLAEGWREEENEIVKDGVCITILPYMQNCLGTIVEGGLDMEGDFKHPDGWVFEGSVVEPLDDDDSQIAADSKAACTCDITLLLREGCACGGV